MSESAERAYIFEKETNDTKEQSPSQDDSTMQDDSSQQEDQPGNTHGWAVLYTTYQMETNTGITISGLSA